MAASRTRQWRTLTISALATVLALQSVMGQQTPTSQLTSAHELLKKDVGTWDTEIRIWPSPHGKPVVSKGHETSKLLPGGLWLETRFEGTMGNERCVGVGSWGYDPVEKKYVGTWVDSMTPHITFISGDYDLETKTMTHISEGRDPTTGEKYMRKSTLRYMDDGSRLVEAYTTDENGRTWKMMEVKYLLQRP